jgi:hypothetical protein
VTDPRQRQVDRLAALEPWALELLREDSAERRAEQGSPEEVARLVALLRSLPEPEPSHDLTPRVLEYIAAQQARPRVMRLAAAAVHRLGSPATALALAAAIAALLAVVVPPSSLPSLLHSGDPGGEAELSSSARPSFASVPPSHSTRRRAVVIRPQFVSAVFAQTPAAPPHLRLDRAPLEDAFALRLDQQLNQLMIDPTAFAQRLERMAQRDQFISRLAARATERGDAPEIALRVRQSPHPIATLLVERLLGATLVASISPR